MSDTPRTDNAERQCQCKHGCHVSSFAMEQMERELNEWRDLCRLLHEIIEACDCNAPPGIMGRMKKLFSELNK